MIKNTFKSAREKMRNKKGFTLVELIVVIVIILILAAVLIPSVIKYINKANEANIKSDAASILTQVQADVAAYNAGEVGDTTVAEDLIYDGTDFEACGNYAYTATVITAKGTSKQYHVDLNTAKDEVIGIQVQNGKHFMTWTKDAGWSLDA